MCSNKKFFTLWLPLNENDFFHLISKDNNPLDAGAVNKTIEYFFSSKDFIVKDNSTLYLKKNHQFFSREENENYFVDIQKIQQEAKKNPLKESEKYQETIARYLSDDILEGCDIKIENNNDISIIKNEINESKDNDVKIDKNQISYLSLDVSCKSENLNFTLTFDSFGFYFFDFSSNEDNYKQEKALKIIENLFGGEYICHSMSKEHPYDNHNICSYIKNPSKGYKGILTHNQLLYLQEGILNFNLNHKIFFEIIKYEDENENEYLVNLLKEYSLSKFIRKILVSYENINDINVNNFLLKKKKKINLENLKARKYNFNFFKDSDFNHINIDNYILERYENNDAIDNKRDFKYILVQDAIEEASMQQFLSIILTYPYIEEIENSVYVVRKRLTTKMMELSSESEIDQLSFDSDTIKYLYSEEKLSNYIKLIVSKVPILFRVDNILRDAYYVKIGNLTNMNFTTDSEQIDKLSVYRTWKGTLHTIQNNKKTLVENLDSYNQMKLIKIADESRRLLINSNDREDIKYAWDDKEDNQLMPIFVIISAVYYALHSGLSEHASAEIKYKLISKLNELIVKVIPPIEHNLFDKIMNNIIIYFITIFILYLIIDKSKSYVSKFYNFLFNSSLSNQYNIEYRKKYESLESFYFKDVKEVDISTILQKMMKKREEYIESIKGIKSDIFIIDPKKLKIINKSHSLLNEDTFRLNIQLQIPEIKINHKKYDELQLFYVMTVDIKKSKENRIDYFLDSAKIYFKLKSKSWIMKKLFSTFYKKKSKLITTEELELEIYNKFMEEIFKPKEDKNEPINLEH